jgi:hypothetical protein
MTTTATHILEEFKALSPAERRQVFEAIAQETAAATPRSPRLEPGRANRIRLEPGLANEIALSHVFNPEEA